MSAIIQRWHNQTATTPAERADTSAEPARHKGSESSSTSAGGGLRDALKGAGVDEASLELKKPEEAAGGAGSNAEARRVEVMIAQ